MTADSKESVFSRWSRRKQEARQEIEDSLPETAPEVLSEPADQPVEAASETDKPVLTDADMPDLDTLDENSDFSPFMSSGVSDELRNLALRKLFRAPVFNIRDGLDEYDDDFTTFEKLGDVVTADMKHRLEMEQQKLREALAEKESGEGEDGQDEVVEAPGEEKSTDTVEAPAEDDEDETRRLAQLDSDAVPREPEDEL